MKLLLFVLLCIMGLGVVYQFFMEESFPKTVTIGEKTYTLEVAAEDESRKLGLGERESLCDNCAMLFIFDTAERHGFWMKGMRFPIDIIWLHDDTIVHIERNISPTSKASYHPSQPANRVLEVNADESKDWKVGDTITFS